MLLEILKKMIACRSISPNDDGTIPLIIEELNKIGFISKTISFGEGEEKVDNLYTRLGTKGPNLCFAGHTDVVPPGPLIEWRNDPFFCSVKDGIIYGRGTVDMKGAIAAFITAAHRVMTTRPEILDLMSMSIMLTSDEEAIAINGTKKLLPWLEEQGEKIDACFVGEPVSRNTICDTIKIGARGSATFFLEIFGKQGHVAYNEYADNAIAKLNKIITLFRAHTLHPGDSIFDASNMEMTNIIVGNEAENVIPGKAKLQFNIRYGDHHRAESLFANYQDILQKHLNPEEFAFNYRSSGDAFVCKTEDFVQLVRESIKNIIGIEPEVNTAGGTSDARFIHKYCSTLEVGLMGRTAHQVNECSSVNDLEILTRVYEGIILGYYERISI